MDYTQDSGAIVLGWLTKLAATIALVGLIAFDGVSLVQAHFSAADRAGTYASSAAEKYQGTKDINAAYAEAEAAAQIDGDSVDIQGFSVTPDGHAHLTLRHSAKTLWMHKIGFLKKFTVVTEQGEGAGAQ